MQPFGRGKTPVPPLRAPLRVVLTTSIKSRRPCVRQFSGNISPGLFGFEKLKFSEFFYTRVRSNRMNEINFWSPKFFVGLGFHIWGS